MDNDFATGYALGSDNNGGGNDGMWGGNGSWIFAFLIIALIFGGNGWGWGNNGGNGAGYQGAVTRSDLCSEFNFNNLSRSVLGIQDGLCNGFYSMNNGMLTGLAQFLTASTAWTIRFASSAIRTPSLSTA